MQDVPRLPQPNRTLVVSLLAAALGAGVATATFAVVNIEDQPSVSLPAVVQSAPPSVAIAAERSDGGPEEGTAQQAMQPAYLKVVSPSSEPRYDGGPDEGSSASAIARP